MARKLSKRMKSVASKADTAKTYSLEEALKLLQESPKVKFDQTVDVAINLGIDPKKSDQQVRGTVLLPNGLGKKVNVLVFAKGDKAEEAKTAGADHVGAEDLVAKIQDGWLDFDVAVATPDMMPVIGKLGKILGTRGLMPNPKTGTVTPNVKDAVRELKAGKVVYKVEKAGILHVPVGKISFQAPALAENIRALVHAVTRVRPASLKGDMVRRMYITSTMGPGFRINLAQLEAA